MGSLKNKSVKSLISGIDDYEAQKKRINGSSLSSIKNLYEEFLKTDDKRKRDRLVSEFKKRNQEFMSIINEDPELIESEIRRSLLMAAVGGEYTEEEISVDGKGKTKVKHVKKNALPDVSAAKELLNILGGNENTESDLAQAWIDSVIGGSGDEEEE